MSESTEVIQITRLDNGHYHVFMDNALEVAPLHVVLDVRLGMMPAIKDRPLVIKDVNERVIEIHHDDFVTSIKDGITKEELGMVEIYAGHPVWFSLVGIPVQYRRYGNLNHDPIENQVSPLVTETRPQIQTEALLPNYVRFYRDRGGEWCCGKDRISLQLNPETDWYIKGLYGLAPDVVVLSVESGKAYRIETTSPGLPFRVWELDLPKLERLDEYQGWCWPDEENGTEVQAFELTTSHTFHKIVLADRVPAEL